MFRSSIPVQRGPILAFSWQHSTVLHRVAHFLTDGYAAGRPSASVASQSASRVA